MKATLKKYNSLPLQVRASIWFLICAFMQKAVSFITTPIFTRLMSTAEYGQYSVFNSWYSIITVFVSLNLYSGVYAQGIIKFEDERAQFISSFQGLTTTLVLGWTIIYFLFHDFWNQLFTLSTVQMLAMLVMIWTTAVFNFWSTEQRVDLKYRTLVVITIAVSLAKPIIGIFLVINANDKVTARILGMMVVELVAYSGLYVAQMRRGHRFFYGKFWKYALAFNIPLIPHYLSSSVLNSADRIMIQQMVDSESAGIYNLAYNVAQIMTMFNMALLQTIEPWLFKKIKAHNFKDISAVAYPSFIGVATVNLLLIIFAPEIVSLFAPPTYSEAVIIVPPVAMSVFFIFAYSFFSVFEFYYEKMYFIAGATIAGALLNVVLNYCFIKRFGYIAAGYTTLFCYAVYAVAHYMFMIKICKDHLNGVKVYNFRIILLIATVFLLTGFSCMMLYKKPILRYGVMCIALILAFFWRKKIIEYIIRLISIRKKDYV